MFAVRRTWNHLFVLWQLRTDCDCSLVGLCSEAELYLTASIYSNGQLIGMPLTSTYKYSPTGPNQPFRWDEWLTFPVKYRDLSPTSRLVITIYDVTHDPRRVAERYPTGTAATIAVPQSPALLPNSSTPQLQSQSSQSATTGSALATVSDGAQPSKGKLGVKPSTPRSGGSGSSGGPGALVKSFSLPLGGSSDAQSQSGAATSPTNGAGAGANSTSLAKIDPSQTTLANSGLWNRSSAVPNALPAAPLTYSVQALSSLSMPPIADVFAVVVGGTTMPLFNKKG
jgi:hypothetical protein